MSVPLFITFLTTGDVYISSTHDDVPAGTITGTFRINPGATLTKLTTVSGTNPYSVSGSTGRDGKEWGK